MAGREHTLDRSKIHYKWDNSLPPAIEIESGDTVHCETEEVSDGQIKPGMPASMNETWLTWTFSCATLPT